MSTYPENPFVLVYDELWRMAMCSDVLRSLVKPGNRISYGSPTNRDPVKDQAQAADYPLLDLIPMGVSGGNLHNSSSSSLLDRSYAFVVTTGDYRLHPYLHQAEWALVCALANWKENLAQLIWRGKSFVVLANLMGVTEAMNDMLRNKGIAGWSCAWMCSIKFKFQTADLVADLKQEGLLL